MHAFRMMIVYVICALASQGCGMGLFNSSGAIVEDKLGKFRTLAVTSERRVIMFNGERERFCAEPPPDVAQNISSTLQAASNISGGKLPAEMGAEFSRAMAITAQRLMNRSQGLQLYRDGMYYLCQGFLNGVVSDTEFKDKSLALLQTAHDLIKHEITISNGVINAPSNTPSTTAPESLPLPVRPLKPSQ